MHSSRMKCPVKEDKKKRDKERERGRERESERGKQRESEKEGEKRSVVEWLFSFEGRFGMGVYNSPLLAWFVAVSLALMWSDWCESGR